jgi:hypothetical protein
MNHHPSPRRAVWIAQLAAAAILGQTLFFKFSGAAESVWIFTTLGAEPWGRLGSGAVEALAVVLLLVPRLAVFGALLGAGTMLGAIASHALFLGIEVQGDGGLLFALANVVLVACAIVIALRRAQLRALLPVR